MRLRGRSPEGIEPLIAHRGKRQGQTTAGFLRCHWARPNEGTSAPSKICDSPVTSVRLTEDADPRAGLPDDEEALT